MSELQDVFCKYGEAYRSAHLLPPHILRAMNCIEHCRTAVLGGHVDVCEDCGNVRVSYNSCRNRHCPKCQNLSKERWIEARKDDLLNIPYFHAVFTIPDILRPVVFQNQRKLYALLFRCASETILELAGSKKYLGVKAGCTAILHTWGSNLTFHPHIHCIVPGGGIDSLGRWRSSGKKFFLPVRVMSRLFRGKFLSHLSAMNLDFYGEQKHLESPADFQRLLQSCYKKEWVAYCKPPFGNAEKVVQYLGRYTHRVAIGNNRIIRIANGEIAFKWKDYKDGSRWKVIALSADEFIRRFLLHILPPHFMKIRHYGILANRGKKQRIQICKQLTGTPIRLQKKTSTQELILQTTGIDIALCPTCGSSNLKAKPLGSDSS